MPILDETIWVDTCENRARLLVFTTPLRAPSNARYWNDLLACSRRWLKNRVKLICIRIVKFDGSVKTSYKWWKKWKLKTKYLSELTDCEILSFWIIGHGANISMIVVDPCSPSWYLEWLLFGILNTIFKLRLFQNLLRLTLVLCPLFRKIKLILNYLRFKVQINK